VPTPQTGPAKLYRTRRRDTPFQVVYRDPTKRTKSGRAKRVVKWFAQEIDAENHRDDLNERLLTEGSAGVGFDANVRADAVAARRHLDAHGQQATSLLQLALRFTSEVTTHATAALPIGPQLEEFLHEKSHIDGSEVETVKNLETRIWMWVELAKVSTVGDITRESVECLRMRNVHPQTRRNDMNAVSAFCSFLLDKRRLDHHPLKGLKRPKVPHRRPPVHTAAECQRVLTAAAGYLGGKWLGSFVALYYTGARPSELTETRFVYDGEPLARIEGGKLVGRANRTLPLNAGAVAWMAAAGSPPSVPMLPRYVRTIVRKMAGVKWPPDIPRHTYISNRLAIVNDDAAVAREAGTSEAMIHRHYHQLRTAAEARAWADLRPKG
jgi:integrase